MDLPEYEGEDDYKLTAFEIYNQCFEDAPVIDFIVNAGGVAFFKKYGAEAGKCAEKLEDLYSQCEFLEEKLREIAHSKMMEDHKIIHPGCEWFQEERYSGEYPQNIKDCGCLSGTSAEEHKQDDPHIGCFSYPNCDLSSSGCVLLYGNDAEPFGHKG